MYLVSNALGVLNSLGTLKLRTDRLKGDTPYTQARLSDMAQYDED